MLSSAQFGAGCPVVEAPAPHLTTRRTALIGGMLALTSAAGAGVKLLERQEAPFRGLLGGGIPKRLGPWAAMETTNLVRPEEEPAEETRYDQEVSRIYEAPDQLPVMLLIAFGSTQSDTLQVHRPEFCYPAAGFKIEPRDEASIPLGGGGQVPAAFFTGVRGDRVEHILYWTRLGEQFPTTWVQQHIARAKNSLQGLVPNGVLVRASVIGSDANSAREQLTSFLAALVQRSSPVAQRALIGRLAA